MIEEEPLIDLELASQELKRPKDQIMIACYAFLNDDDKNGLAEIKQNLFDGNLHKMQSAAYSNIAVTKEAGLYRLAYILQQMEQSV